MTIRQLGTGSLVTSSLNGNKERWDLLLIIPLEGTLSQCYTTSHGSSCYSWSLTCASQAHVLNTWFLTHEASLEGPDVVGNKSLGKGH